MSDAELTRIAARVRRDLARMARSAGVFDARRYFRGSADLRFHNVRTPSLRLLARTICVEHRGVWTVHTAVRFADLLVGDPHLETKAVAIEVLSTFRSALTPDLLATWKHWLARGDASNWATTDAICGRLIGPLLVDRPALAEDVAGWRTDPNMWVRRASAVGLIPLVRRGRALGLAYRVARALHPDKEDLIQKAVGWLLREAGKSDRSRLERYLCETVSTIPRTTFRYAIERFPEPRRRVLMAVARRTGRAKQARPRRAAAK
jgi:3-methyladenine DNA glycosylase AlkD